MTLQANYEKTNYIDFLQSQLSGFQAGSGTVFQTSEFSYFFDFADSGELSIEDVSRELYYLCLSEGFETTVWTEAAEPAPQQTSAPSVEYVAVPNIVGALDGEAKSWLFQNGYDFAFDVKSTGFNPKLSCLMSGRNLVVDQSPVAGTQVENSFSSRLTAYVECVW
jgi:hypothetical protein